MAVRKVTVNLPEDQVQFLQEVSQRDNIPFTDVLRRAINSERFFVEQELAGRKVLIEEPGQHLRIVVRK